MKCDVPIINIMTFIRDDKSTRLSVDSETYASESTESL